MSPKPIKIFLMVMYPFTRCIWAVLGKETWARLALPRVWKPPGHLAVPECWGKADCVDCAAKAWWAVVCVRHSWALSSLHTFLKLYYKSFYKVWLGRNISVSWSELYKKQKKWCFSSGCEGRTCIWSFIASRRDTFDCYNQICLSYLSIAGLSD